MYVKDGAMLEFFCSRLHTLMYGSCLHFLNYFIPDKPNNCYLNKLV